MALPTHTTKDLSSSEYHNMGGTYSSSQLKDLLDDPEYFYRKYIKKEIEREESSAFDMGTYFHTALLEPEKLTLECAVYEGFRKGAKWDEFKAANSGKAIITKSELEKAEGLISAVKNSPIAMNRLRRGEPEVSAFVNILVVDGTIYCPERDMAVDKLRGLYSVKKCPTKGTKLTIKVRADLLAEDFILDLKSTTGNAKSSKDMRSKISNYNYDLSASLYLDMFSLALCKKITKFIWTFASKDYFNSKSYIASDKNIAVGRAKYYKAILTLAECMESKWEFEDSLGILEPMGFELEHIEPTGEELL